MTDLLGAEVLKLRTVRSTWLLIAAAQLIVVAGISGLVLSGSDLRKAATASTAVSHVGLASLCSLLLGILAVAGEYRHRTVTDSYLSTPKRDRSLLAKLAVYTTFGFGVGVVTSVTALLSAMIWWAAKGATFSLSNGDVWRTVAGGIAWNAAFAAIGVGVGALVRNLAGAIAVALAWIALVEGIIGQLIGKGLSRWLPFSAGQALGRLGSSSSSSSSSAGQMSQWGAAALLAGYAVLLAVCALSSTLRLDVS